MSLSCRVQLSSVNHSEDASCCVTLALHMHHFSTSGSSSAVQVFHVR